MDSCWNARSSADVPRNGGKVFVIASLGTFGRSAPTGGEVAETSRVYSGPLVRANVTNNKGP
jgi:hypothetical protein